MKRDVVTSVGAAETERLKRCLHKMKDTIDEDGKTFSVGLASF